MKMNLSKKLLYVFGVLIGIVVIVLAFQPKDRSKHLALTVAPLTSELTIPSASIYFNTFIESIDVKYIFTHNNLLYGVTQNEIVDLQTKKVTANLQNIQLLSLNSEAALVKEGGDGSTQILTYPFSATSTRPINSNFTSPSINSVGSAVIDCTERPQALINDGLLKSKIKVDSPACFWTSNNVVVIQGKNQTYVWDVKTDTKASIKTDDGEKAIYATGNTLFTNKDGVLGIRNVDSVRGVAFHKGSTLHIVYLDQEESTVLIFEVVQEGELSRGYIYKLKIINGAPSRPIIIGSTHPVPEGIDTLYRPLHLNRNAIMVIRTVSGKYWLGSLIPSKLPYQSQSGPELYEPVGMGFSEDPTYLESSFSE